MKHIDKNILKQYIKDVMNDHLSDIYDNGYEHAGEFDIFEDDELEKFEKKWKTACDSIIKRMNETGCL